MSQVDNYKQIAVKAATQHGLDPQLFLRQINAESNFNPNAGSGAGAVGIAQFMPATAKSLGINPRDPAQALQGAAKLMAGYVKKYGSYENALRAYNAGEGAIKASHGYGETNAYVQKILHGPSVSMPGGSSSTSSIAGLAATRVPGAKSSTTTTSNAADVAAASDKNRRIALVSDYLSKSDPGSPLLRSALLQPVAVPGLKTSTQTTPAGLPKASRIAAAVTQPRGGGKVQVEASANRQGVSIQKPILGFLHQLAGTMGRTVDVTTGTNHNQYVAGRPGVQSDHWTGNATDLGMGGDARQLAAVDKKGTLVAAHAIELASRQAGKPIGFKQAYAMAHAGGLWNFQTKQGRVQILWKTMQGGDHYNHVHIGVNPGA